MRWESSVEIAFRCKNCGYKDIYTITVYDARRLLREFECPKCNGIGVFNNDKCMKCDGGGYIRNYVPCCKCNRSDWVFLWMVPFILEIDDEAMRKKYPFGDKKLVNWFMANKYPFINARKKIQEMKIEKIIKNKKKIVNEGKTYNKTEEKKWISDFF